MGNIISGDFGGLENISSVLGFSISESRETESYSSANTNRAMGRNKGVFGFRGTYSALGAVPQMMPRDKVLLQKFFLGPDDGAYNATSMKGTVYVGDIIVDKVVISWNWEAQDPITHTVSFSGEGLLTALYDIDFVPDTTAVNVNDVCPTKVEISGVSGSAFYGLEDLTSAALTFTAANHPYADASTGCNRRFLPGNIDFTLGMSRQETKRQVNQQNPTFELEIESGIDYQIRMYTDDIAFWLLKWAMMKDHTNIQGDIQGFPSRIVGFDKSFQMQANNGLGIGEIVFPNTNVWWP